MSAFDKGRDLILYVRERYSSSGYYHIEASVWYREGAELPFGPDPYCGLKMSCQVNATDDRNAYGFSFGYEDLHYVDRRQAEVMVKTLRMVERKMEKWSTEFGRPSTFPMFVQRVCKALGVQLSKNDIPGDCMEGGAGGVSCAVSAIERALYRFKKAGQEAAV